MAPAAWDLWALPLGVALDALVGDPRGWPHPVRVIGWLTRWTEKGLRLAVARAGARGWQEYAAGVLLATGVIGATLLSVYGLVHTSLRAGWFGVVFIEGLLVYWGLAIRSLGVEAVRAAEEPDLFRAREELAMIVGRDTATLDRPEICRACVETVAENCNDAVVAPLFWFAVGGPVGLWTYKAINTLDSMVGYRDPRYARFGWASARLDDLASFLPARLTWLFLALGAWARGESARAALRVGWRDGRNHPSPNAGWGEAAMAGALGVRLGGAATYGGVSSQKPYLGDPQGPIDVSTVRRSVRVMRAAAGFAVVSAWIARAGVFRLVGFA